MSYPLVSSAINNYVSRSMVKEYTDRVAQMPSEKTQKMFEEQDIFKILPCLSAVQAHIP